MKIFVGNLSFNAVPADVKALFEGFGSVSLVDIVMDKKGKKPRGFAFVEMPDEIQANAAITALNSKEFMGRPLSVSPSIPKAQLRQDLIRGEESKPRSAAEPQREDNQLERRPRKGEKPMERYRPQGPSKPWQKSSGESKPWKKVAGELRPLQKSGGESKPWRKPAGDSRPWKKSGGESRPWKKPGGDSRPWKKSGGESRPWKKPEGESKPWQKSGGESRPWRKSQGDSRNSKPWQKSDGELKPGKKIEGELRPLQQSGDEYRRRRKPEGDARRPQRSSF